MTDSYAEFLSPAPRAIALHCSAGAPSQWDPYRERLQDHVRLVAPPLAGYDGTAWPHGATVSLEVEARRLLPLLAREGGPVDLIGHSYGGAVALKVASLWPERVRSVTVFEPVLFHLLQADRSSTRLAGEVRRLAADMALALDAREPQVAAQRFVDYWSGEGTWQRVGPQRREPMVRSMPKVCAEFGALSAAEAVDYAALTPAGPHVRLVVGDASPEPVRRLCALLHTRLPHAHWTELRGAGHMAPLVRPDLLAPLLFPAHWREPMALAA